jgi:hypothetical protein
MRLARLAMAVGLGLLLGACHEREDNAGPAEEDQAIASAKARTSRAHERMLPTGPSFAIEAGRGIGAIRFGATVPTIERLMDRRCEVLSDNLCRYYTRGVDFHLVNGALAKVHVQRAGRSAGNDVTGKKLTFGFFNGGIRPDLALGMTPKAVQEYLGPPERIERVPEPNPSNMVARDYYPGLVIEYDRYENGKIIWAGAIVFPDQKAAEIPEIGTRSGKWKLSPASASAPASAASSATGPRRPEVVH